MRRMPLMCLADVAAGTKYENYLGSNDGSMDVYGQVRAGQSITIGTGHTCRTVKVQVQRTGSPGTVTLDIHVADGSGLPTGVVLESANFDGDVISASGGGELKAVTVSQYLAYGQKYVISLHAASGDVSNKLVWINDQTSPTYSGGNTVSSTDGGSSWTNSATYDQWFEEWS